MNELSFDYSIHSDLPAHPERPSIIGEKFVNTLDALSRIDPTIFTNWRVMDFRKSVMLPLAAARPRIAAIVENGVSRDDLGRAEPEEGYDVAASAGDFGTSRSVDIRILAAGKRKGDLALQTGDYNVRADPAIVTYPLFKAVLLAIRGVWLPPWACATAFELGYHGAPLFRGAPLFPYSRFHIPWIAYLSAPLALALELPGDILTERTPDGGLLMIATEERLDPANPEHLRRARILAATLMARTGYKPSRPAK